jgi:hypothetical protein
MLDDLLGDVRAVLHRSEGQSEPHVNR